MKQREPRILLINDHKPEELAYIWKKRFPCRKIDSEVSVTKATTSKNPRNYNVLIIDASCNLPVRRFETFTQYAISRNPDLFVIGTSIMGEYFEKDDLARRTYDFLHSGIFLACEESTNCLRNAMEERGFVFEGKKQNGKQK